MKKWPNLLLVAGTNRNVGKTTFICRLIENTAKFNTVTAIKITPHFHEETYALHLIKKNSNFIVSKELSKDINKDSSKMLAAGARQVFYIQSTDEYLTQAIEEIEPYFTANEAIVCESGALRKFIEPGLFVLMSKKEKVKQWKSWEWSNWADIHIFDYRYNKRSFLFKNGLWYFNSGIIFFLLKGLNR